MAAKKKTGGSWLTSDVGPLPGWGWVAVAGAGVVLWRKMSASSSTAAATPAGGSVVGTTSSPYYDLYGAGFNAGVGALTAALGTSSGVGGGSGATSGTTAQPTPASSNSGVLQGTVGTAPGDFELVSGTAQNKQLAASGVTQYEALPGGNFAPLPAMSGSAGYGVYAPQTYQRVA